MGRVGQPDEIAPGYVFLASADASYITGQVIHANGGTIVGGCMPFARLTTIDNFRRA